MISEEKIAELKTKYGKIFKITISSDEYVYRPLKMGEYKELQSKYEQFITSQGVSDPKAAANLELEIVEKCIIFPEAVIIDELGAGVPAILSGKIFEASGFTNDVVVEEL